MSQITVRKLNLSSELIWQYEGRLLRRDAHAVVLEAFFNLADMPVVDVS